MGGVNIMEISKPLPLKIQKMQVAGNIAANILVELMDMCKPGRKTIEINDAAIALCNEYEVESLAYGQVDGKTGKLFPGHICISVNDVVTHGYGTEDIVLKEGDLVSVDVAIEKDGYCGDNCRSLIVGGSGSKEAEKLLHVTRSALQKAIKVSRTGVKVGDISHTIQSYVESEGFSVVRDLVGHSIGKQMWEDPLIPNFGRPGEGKQLGRFHTIAMDTMVNAGGWRVHFSTADGWTVTTADGSLSCVFEDTYYIDDNGGVVLTKES